MRTPAGARLVDDPGELEAFFSDRRAAHIYALVDLEPPFWEGSSWFRRDEAVVGVVALPDGDGLAVYAVSTKDAEGSIELLCQLASELPAGQLITGPTGMDEALRAVRPVAPLGPHVRYEMAGPSAAAAAADVVALGPADLPAIEALYATEPGAAFFLPHMLDDETFVGAHEGGELIAVAGTHVVSERQGVAAIGGVLTRSDRRGRGLGRAVTAGVVERLAGRVEVIGLNVHADNRPARAVYEALGFVAIHTYAETELV
ncbi:MAG: GNAT family N-acetyltransferase [Actinomycetota bacterium]